MKRALVAFALAGCASQQSPKPLPIQPAPLSESPRGRAEALVGEPQVSPEQWKALGPDALVALEQIANDPAETNDRRVHALRGAATLDDPKTGEFLHATAADANQPASLRAESTLSLAAHDGKNATASLAALLADPVADVRLAAARGLGLVGGDPARAALQSRLDAETDAHVREEIQKSIARATN